MIWNNIKIALRNLRKNKAFAVINIAGLALGLSIFVFGGLLVAYERNHDTFFENHENIYTIGSIASEDLDVGIDSLNATFSAIGPIIEAEFPDIEAVARTLSGEFLLSAGAESFYENVRFADADILRIFPLEYISGDANALDDPTSLIISESSAIKYFGHTDVIGQTVTFDNEYDFRVTAVFKELPKNSHFNSMPIFSAGFDYVSPIKALVPMWDFNEAGGYNNLSPENMTYVMLPPSLDQDWLQSQVDSIYARLMPEDISETISGFFASPLKNANLSVWDTFSVPAVAVVQLLSFLVLVVACVNYTNLATAQALGRSREVGMRKTMGATQRQLLTQFLIESVTIAGIAMVVAVAVLEIIIPLFNNSAGKVMRLDYAATLPWLFLTTLAVGLFAGLYPAWLITRASPIDALRELARKGKSGARVRSVMIGVQFAISAFMLSMVVVVYVQNQKVQESSYIFPRAEIYNLERIDVDSIQARLDTLSHELEALPNVDSVAWSSQVPYELNNSFDKVGPVPSDEAGAFNMQIMWMSPGFLETYDIPILAGRNLDQDLATDIVISDETEVVNVVVNELALVNLGIESPQAAINQHIYNFEDDRTLREMVIVGVVPTQNIVGLFNSEKPWMFLHSVSQLNTGSVRISGGSVFSTIEQIEDVWKRVIPEYPMQGRFLDDVFDDVYKVLKYVNAALAGFAFIALALALIGLFGLAAFMAAQRTKEIGVRKVMGASSLQIARLLVWQFSKPVAWALAIALPVAYIASDTYLNFFPDRIGSPVPVLLIAGVVAVLLACSTVAGHAVRIARSNPVLALRYE